MMKRCFAAILCACMLFSLCSFARAQEAEGMLASYVMPDEAQVYYLPAGEFPEVPEGMEAMYALMDPFTFNGDLYLMTMKNSQVLLSVSGMFALRDMTAEEMQAQWPRMAADMRIESGALSVNADPACAQVEELGGVNVLHVTTQIHLDTDGVSALIAEGYAFCDGGAVTELWALYPDPEDPVHADRAEAIAADLADLNAMLETLTFPSGDSQMLQAVPYEDAKGRFAMAVPVWSMALTAESTDEDRQTVRKAFVENNPEGADRVFDRFMRQLDEVDSVLIFTKDMQGVIKVTATPEQCLAGVEAEGLASMAPTFETTLAKDFDLAVCMESDQYATISQLEHALMGYWLRMGEMDLQLDLMVCVHPDNWLYEVDIFTAEGNQQVRSELYAFVTQTLVYTPPVNALN